jgi:type II secretory pathway pseudopilin PulG
MYPYSQGFAYVALLALLGMLAMAAQFHGETLALDQKRANEEALLRAGREVRAAIDQFYVATPGGVKLFPRALSELTKDQRMLGTVRYLRKIPIDPHTGADDWALLRDSTGGIYGVTSRSTNTPLKRRGFDPNESAFSEAKTYADWVFLSQFKPK